ncbi:unnamed protein product [Dracunculus medinensis]|uniref:Alanine--tRNA ligase n=1 Tax=Dracunculus medinensis TaxID=318479 RepID=A0A0N4UDQ8_DRAME|nr:unnamed protein product [Dracunculus medinensis]
MKRHRGIIKQVTRRYLFTKMSSSELRSSFLEYFISLNHTYVQPSSIVSHDDPSLPFTNAGMNQFRPIFLGAVEANSELGRLKRAVNSQGCIRVGGKHNDWEHVGRDLTHHTFFEMLGNWSFGDYFKEEACYFAWNFLTKILSVPPEKLYITYFAGNDKYALPPDYECRDIWKKIGVNPGRILPFGLKHNFWEIAECGPCGPSSEIHIDVQGSNDASASVNINGSSVVELWNLVFLQFNKEPSGLLKPLPRQHIDCGLGFERMTAVMQNVITSYDTDIFIPLLEEVSKYSNVGLYEGRVGEHDLNNKDSAYRIIADHLRTSCILISDGVRASVKGQGNVLRRLLRRAARASYLFLKADQGHLSNIVPFFIYHLKNSYPDMLKNDEVIEKVVKEEEEQFWKLRKEGEKRFHSVISQLPENSLILPGSIAWNLHNEGVNIEMASLLAEEKGLIVDMVGFEKEKALAQALSKSSFERRRTVVSDCSNQLTNQEIPVTNDLFKYNYSRSNSGEYSFAEIGGKILAIFDMNRRICNSLSVSKEGYIVVDVTNFFAEQGGQLSDTGILFDKNRQPVFSVKDVQRHKNYVFLIGTTLHSDLTVNMEIYQRINEGRRLSLMRNHTATHLLRYAIQKVCGTGVQQCGSLISAENLRFDCSLNRDLTPDEIAEIDLLINDIISSSQTIADRNVSIENIEFSQNDFPQKFDWNDLGANRTVRIIQIGDISIGSKFEIKEYCCGTHVLSTSDIQAFTIYAGETVGRGKRRLYAWTGTLAESALYIGTTMRSKISLLSSNMKVEDAKNFMKDYIGIKHKLPLWMKREMKESVRQIKKDIKKREKKLI